MIYRTSIAFLVGVTIISCLSSIGFAQAPENVMIKGSVVAASGAIIPYASVALKGTSYGAQTNDKGQFTFKAPVGNYTLSVVYVGYISNEKPIQIKALGNVPIKVVLQEDNFSLQEVAIVGKTEAQELKETGFSVEAVETKELQSQSI